MLELEKGLKKNLTIPNLISFVRILLIIPFVYFFFIDNYFMAFAMILVSGISDMLDGWIARKFNQVSDLGKILDPIADKLTLVTVVICVGILIPQIIPIVVLLVSKDLLMLAGGYYLIRKKITPPAAKWYGKAATIVFYISIILIVFGKAIFNMESPIFTAVLLVITTAAMIFALVKYFLIFLSLIKEKKKTENTKNN